MVNVFLKQKHVMDSSGNLNTQGLKHGCNYFHMLYSSHNLFLKYNHNGNYFHINCNSQCIFFKHRNNGSFFVKSEHTSSQVKRCSLSQGFKIIAMCKHSASFSEL